MKGDIDILLTHARHLDHGDDRIAVLIEIERGTPATKKLRLPSKIARRWQLKKAVHFVAERGPPIEGRPGGDFGRLVTY